MHALPLGFERDDLAVRPRLTRDATDGEQLAGDAWSALAQLAARGRTQLSERRFQEAWESLGECVRRLPEPRHRWEAAGWLFAALGECAWQLGEYQVATKFLAHALAAPGVVGNAFVHMRLGQARWELGADLGGARSELAYALEAGGARVFRDEPPHYHALLLGELVPAVPDAVFEDLRASMRAATAEQDPGTEVVAAILDSARHVLLAEAVAGARVVIVHASPASARTPGDRTGVDDPDLEVRIERIIEARGLRLAHAIVRRGTLRVGSRLRAD